MAVLIEEHRSGIVRQGKWTTSKLDESTDLGVRDKRVVIVMQMNSELYAMRLID